MCFLSKFYNFKIKCIKFVYFIILKTRTCVDVGFESNDVSTMNTINFEE